jgi:lysophospholipase L1-like esterase
VNSWKIVDNGLLGGAGYYGTSLTWKSSPMLQTTYSVANGKATFDYDSTVTGSNVIGILARYNPADGSGMFFGVSESSSNAISSLHTWILREGNYGDINSGPTRIRLDGNVTINNLTSNVLPDHTREELILDGDDYTFNLYDIDASLTTPVYTFSGSDSRSSSLVGTAWGLNAFNPNAPADNFTLYNVADQYFTVEAAADNVKFGDSVTYTITDDEDRTINNFSDGANGTFSPTSVELNSGNSYSATITYTPVKFGQHTVTADVSGGETFESEIGVWPYNMKVGLLGDSITNVMGTTFVAEALGSGFSVINAAVCGGRVGDLANDYIDHSVCGGLTAESGTWTTDALNLFAANDVEVVHIMIGTNDLSSWTPEQYKTGMQAIIDKLRDNSITGINIKHLVISKLTWRNASQAIQDKITAYGDVIDELVAENHDFVLLGDESAYDWFLSNPSYLYDGLHPTAAGNEVLADFWANAILGNYEYQINPDSKWLAADNEFVLNRNGSLTFTVDKYLGEFTGVVKVNGTTLSADKYTVSEGSTVIELLNTYLNTLGAGTYTLSVEFAGGVWVESTFTILADGTITPTPVNPNAPAVPGLTSPNTGFNLGKLLKENRGAVLAVISAVITGLGISIALVSRKLAKES